MEGELASAKGRHPRWSSPSSSPSSLPTAPAQDRPFTVTGRSLSASRIVGPALSASIRKDGYVSGVEGGSLLDGRETGELRDLGFGGSTSSTWLMEPGSDEAYRATGSRATCLTSLQQPRALAVAPSSGRSKGPANLHQGRHPRAPRRQQAKTLWPDASRTSPIVSPRPGTRRPGRTREQTIVFPAGRAAYFIAADAGDARSTPSRLPLPPHIDMPGHIKHKGGASFSEVYLSYHGTIEAGEFVRDFPPDAKYAWLPSATTCKVPRRLSSAAYHLLGDEDRRRRPLARRHDVGALGRLRSVVSPEGCVLCLIEEIGGPATDQGPANPSARPTSSASSTRSPRWSGSTTATRAIRGWRSTTGAGGSSRHRIRSGHRHKIRKLDPTRPGWGRGSALPAAREKSSTSPRPPADFRVRPR